VYVYYTSAAFLMRRLKRFSRCRLFLILICNDINYPAWNSNTAGISRARPVIRFEHGFVAFITLQHGHRKVSRVTEQQKNIIFRVFIYMRTEKKLSNVYGKRVRVGNKSVLTRNRSGFFPSPPRRKPLNFMVFGFFPLPFRLPVIKRLFILHA